MLILFIIAFVGIIIYVVEFSNTEDRLNDGVEVPDYANIAEWISFIASIVSIMVLALTFHHDRVDDELIEFWKRITSCCNYRK